MYVGSFGVRQYLRRHINQQSVYCGVYMINMYLTSLFSLPKYPTDSM